MDNEDFLKTTTLEKVLGVLWGFLVLCAFVGVFLMGVRVGLLVQCDQNECNKLHQQNK